MVIRQTKCIECSTRNTILNVQIVQCLYSNNVYTETFPTHNIDYCVSEYFPTPLTTVHDNLVSHKALRHINDYNS